MSDHVDGAQSDKGPWKLILTLKENEKTQALREVSDLPKDTKPVNTRARNRIWGCGPYCPLHPLRTLCPLAPR